MAIKQPLVSVVDDSESVRESLPALLRQFGHEVQAFASAEAFLESDAVLETRCLILDVGLPVMSGPDLQQELTRLGRKIPIIFITGKSTSRSARVSSATEQWRVCSSLSAIRHCSRRSMSHYGRADTCVINQSRFARILRARRSHRVGLRASLWRMSRPLSSSSTTIFRCANRWSC